MVQTRDWLQSLFRMQAPPTSIFFAESLQATTSHDETMIKQRTRSISCDVVIENPFVPSSGFLTRDRSCIPASPVPAQLSEQSVDFRHDLSGAVALQVQSPQTACTSSATPAIWPSGLHLHTRKSGMSWLAAGLHSDGRNDAAIAALSRHPAAPLPSWGTWLSSYRPPG
jgi:hypothetical protein